METTTTPHVTTHAGLGAHLLARWPVALGLLALVLNLSDGAEPHVVAMIIVIAAMCYLAAAALGSRRSGWVMVAVSSVTVVTAALTGLDATALLLAMGAGFAAFGLLRPRGADRREVGRQTLAFLGFGAVALAAMFSGPQGAALLAAAAAIGHAAWDVLHVVRDRVVTRSLAEACFVLDLGLGLALVVVALSA